MIRLTLAALFALAASACGAQEQSAPAFRESSSCRSSGKIVTDMMARLVERASDAEELVKEEFDSPYARIQSQKDVIDTECSRTVNATYSEMVYELAFTNLALVGCVDPDLPNCDQVALNETGSRGLQAAVKLDEKLLKQLKARSVKRE